MQSRWDIKATKVFINILEVEPRLWRRRPGNIRCGRECSLRTNSRQSASSRRWYRSLWRTARPDFRPRSRKGPGTKAGRRRCCGESAGEGVWEPKAGPKHHQMPDLAACGHWKSCKSWKKLCSFVAIKVTAKNILKSRKPINHWVNSMKNGELRRFPAFFWPQAAHSFLLKIVMFHLLAKPAGGHSADIEREKSRYPGIRTRDLRSIWLTGHVLYRWATTAARGYIEYDRNALVQAWHWALIRTPWYHQGF